MDIIIQEPPTVYSQQIYQGTQSARYSTMTDVKWYSNTKLIAAHRYAGKIYVIDIQENSYNIISTYTLSLRNKLHQTEAFDLDRTNNKIYLISFSEYLFILDILPDFTIQLVKTIQLNKRAIPYHGIRLYNDNVYVTPSYYRPGLETIKKINTSSLTVHDIPSLGSNLRIKSISFLPDNRILVLINYKTETCLTMSSHISSGCLRLYSNNFSTLLDTLELPSCHLDQLITNNYNFYATCRDLEKGFLLKGNIVNAKLIEETRLICNDFPHGIDILENKLVYTSYTTSGIHIIDLF